MVVSTVSQRYHLCDIPDITLSRVVGSLTATIVVGESSVVEHYQPSNGVVKITGLAEFVMDYISGSYSKMEPGDIVEANSTISLVINFHDSNSSKSISISVIPSREPIGLTSTDYFLTRYGNRCLNIGELFLISFIDASRSLKVTGYGYDGSTDYVLYNGSSSGSNKRATYAFDTDFLSGELSIAVDELELVVFELLSGSTVLDKVSVTFNHFGNLFSKTFVYDNVFYVPETITFRGGETEAPILEANNAYVDGKFARLSADHYRQFTTRLGYSDEQTYRSAEDMLYSDDVRIVESNGKWTPVVITAAENSYSKPKSQPATFVITYREAGKHDQGFNRTTPRVGLFDKPYTKTFD